MKELMELQGKRADTGIVESAKNIWERTKNSTKLLLVAGFATFLTSCTEGTNDATYPTQETLQETIISNPMLEKLDSADVSLLKTSFEEADSGKLVDPLLGVPMVLLYNVADEEKTAWERVDFNSEKISYTYFLNYKDAQNEKFDGVLEYIYEKNTDSTYTFTLSNGNVLDYATIDSRTGAILNAYEYDFYNENNKYRISKSGEISGNKTTAQENIRVIKKGLQKIQDGKLLIKDSNKTY